MYVYMYDVCMYVCMYVGEADRGQQSHRVYRQDGLQRAVAVVLSSLHRRHR